MVKLFGTTLEETANALRGGRHLGTESDELAQTRKQERTKAIIRIMVTLVLCLVGGYLVFKEKTTEGVALLTLVAGYWLK